MDAMPSDHEDGMDMGGHEEASPSASTDPHGNATPTDDHGVDMDDQAAPTDDHGAPAGAAGGHDEQPAGSAGGHDDAPAAGESRPREAVFGGFILVNGLILTGAAITRRRDRAKAVAKARPSTTDPKDASR